MNRRMSVAVLLIGVLLLTGCGGGSAAKFCEVVTAANAQIDAADIAEYYERLEAAAPGEIRDDVTTLRQGWQQVSLPLGQAAGGEVSSMSRPPEVSAAAQSVAHYMVEKCGVELGEGIYLIFPEIGW